MDPVILTYILFFLGGIFRPVLQYGLARVEDAQPFNWRYLVGQIAGVVVGFLSLIVFGNLPDVKEVIDNLELPGFLFYVAAFGYGYFWASIGRQGDKGIQLARTGSSAVPPKQ
jgi:hypothetical protein